MGCIRRGGGCSGRFFVASSEEAIAQGLGDKGRSRRAGSKRAVTAMEVYESKSRKVVESFLRHELSFQDCIAALDAALADFIPRLNGEQLFRLRIVMLANNEIVMKEMERRGTVTKIQSSPPPGSRTG